MYKENDFVFRFSRQSSTQWIDYESLSYFQSATKTTYNIL